ncbi:MAG: HAD-IIIA family hydrolase [Chitinophagaceae bacterium]|nr:MAG: HAD-IIIA family hydrolase [Chitinophagaceae bacterium]
MNVPEKEKNSNLSAPFGGQGAAIILAGGLGTRLQSAVPDLPKCLAPVAGRPFLGYLVDHLRREGIERFVFALGYRSEQVLHYLAEAYPTLHYTWTIEEEPLGTGGALKQALAEANAETVLVANGDTLFRVDVPALLREHRESGAVCTLALKPMRDFERYGTVTLEGHRVTGFSEKQPRAEGLVNGGVYLLERARFLALDLPDRFSFEQDYLAPAAARGELAGSVQDAYFIDIGVPEDFERAQQELAAKPFSLDQIDSDWTLFLDRDGVLNDERVGYYVLHPGEFRFSPGVLEAMPLLAQRFGRIVIISNQRGVGKGLMTEQDLADVHTHLLDGIRAAGGRIDAIYYCTEKDDRCFFRKPNPGMALQARREFPEIDLSRTVMVGNKPSDMRFGRAAGVHTVFVTTTNPDQPFPHPDIDASYPSLLAFAQALVGES